MATASHECDVPWRWMANSSWTEHAPRRCCHGDGSPCPKWHTDGQSCHDRGKQFFVWPCTHMHVICRGRNLSLYVSQLHLSSTEQCFHIGYVGLACIQWTPPCSTSVQTFCEDLIAFLSWPELKTWIYNPRVHRLAFRCDGSNIP